MVRQKLHHGWSMQISGETEQIPAIVPGSVYNDLLENGKMKDPFWRDNEMEALKIMDHDFIYTTTFTAEEGIRESEQVLLHCDCLLYTSDAADE